MKRKRRIKYERLKRLRQWRDEVLTCQNMGRVRKLIIDHPSVRKIVTNESIMADVEITLHDGYEFMGRNFWMRIAVSEAIKKVYWHLANRITNKEK